MLHPTFGVHAGWWCAGRKSSFFGSPRRGKATATKILKIRFSRLNKKSILKERQRNKKISCTKR